MNENWSFNEYNDWLVEKSWNCKGEEQSPINIDTNI